MEMVDLESSDREFESWTERQMNTEGLAQVNASQQLF